MKTKFKVKAINLEDIILMTCVLILPIFNGRSGSDFVIIALVLIILLNYIFDKDRAIINKGHIAVLVPLALYFVIDIILYIFNSRDFVEDAERIVQCAFFIIVFIYFLEKKWTNRDLSILKICVKCILALSTLLYIVKGFPDQFASIYSHFNTFGLICFLSVVIILLPYGINQRTNENVLVLSPTYKVTKLDFFFVVDALILELAASSRTSFVISLGFILIVGFFNISNKLFFKKNGLKKFYYIIAIFVAIFICWFTLIYPQLYGTDMGNTLEELSRKYFNKNFFSGRQIIWANILDAMESKKWFGYGLSMIPEYLYSTEFSSHNLYLQTYLQGGLISLIALIYILFTLVVCCIRSNNNRGKVYFIAFILMLCLHECFEVTLTQNQMGISLFVWMLLGFCIKECNIKAKTNKQRARVLRWGGVQLTLICNKVYAYLIDKIKVLQLQRSFLYAGGRL